MFKNYSLVLILLLVVFFSCLDINSSRVSEGSIKSETGYVADKSAVSDSLEQAQGLRQVFHFDFVAFKAKKKSSNSGVARSGLFCKDNDHQLYYSYFAFEGNPVGYEDGIWLTVEKNTTNIGDYTDSENESLIEIKARVEDMDLQQINLVNTSREFVLGKFGEPLFQDRTILMYKDMAGFTLTCRMDSRQRVEWVKLACLRTEVTLVDSVSYFSSYR